MRRIIIRADAGIISTQTGHRDIASGHVMRCLALASDLKGVGIDTVFVCNSACKRADEIMGFVSREGFQISYLEGCETGSTSDSDSLVKIAKSLDVGDVILDSYEFRSDYFSKLKSAGLRVGVVDDTGTQGPYDVDLILNHHSHAENLNYETPNNTLKLLGPGYALIRKDLKGHKKNPPEFFSQPRKILITFGSSDSLNCTKAALLSLKNVLMRQETSSQTPFEIKAVVGASNVNADQIHCAATALSKLPNCKVDVLSHTSKFGNLMKWADFSISATGGSVLELQYIGTPILLVVIHEVQVPIAKSMISQKLAFFGGDALADANCNTQLNNSTDWTTTLETGILRVLSDSNLRKEIIINGQRNVDGNGGERVSLAIFERWFPPHRPID